MQASFHSNICTTDEGKTSSGIRQSISDLLVKANMSTLQSAFSHLNTDCNMNETWCDHLQQHSVIYLIRWSPDLLQVNNHMSERHCNIGRRDQLRLMEVSFKQATSLTDLQNKDRNQFPAVKPKQMLE